MKFFNMFYHVFSAHILIGVYPLKHQSKAFPLLGWDSLGSIVSDIIKTFLS